MKLIKVALFPIIPSVSWQFKFDFTKIAKGRAEGKKEVPTRNRRMIPITYGAFEKKVLFALMITM